MDDSLEGLRARVRRGDESARPALQRAVARAGRSIELAWEGLPLRLGPGVEALGPEERARVDEDLASIDAPRVVALLTRDEPAVAATLVGYPDGRWLVAARWSRRSADAPLLVDVLRARAGLDLTDARGRWHVDWEEVERDSVVTLAAHRALDAARALFDQLGLAFDDPRMERVGPERPPDVPYEAWTAWSSGVRRVRVLERWDELVPLERREHTTHVEVTGLPGGARLRLDQADPGFALRRYVLEARRGRAAQLEEAWLRGLEALARREASPGPWTSLVPEAWRPRADALPLDPRALTRVEAGKDVRFSLLAGAPCEGVRWAVRLMGRLDWRAGPAALAIEPAGPLPEDLSITPLGLARRAATPGAPPLALVVEAITGARLPATPEVEQTGSDLRPALPRRRYRVGSWVALVEDVQHPARGGVSTARVQHEGGELAAFVRFAAMTPTSDAPEELTVWLLGAPGRAAAARERVRERLGADGWELST